MRRFPSGTAPRKDPFSYFQTFAHTPSRSSGGLEGNHAQTRKNIWLDLGDRSAPIKFVKDALASATAASTFRSLLYCGPQPTNRGAIARMRSLGRILIMAQQYK